jgi:hypothetical protein
MPLAKRFTVRVTRTEVWEADITVEAANSNEAEQIVQDRLDQGWSKAFGDDGPDGTLCECCAEVSSVHEEDLVDEGG